MKIVIHDQIKGAMNKELASTEERIQEPHLDRGYASYLNK